MKKKMSEKGLARRLTNALERALSKNGGRARTFAEDGVMTRDAGLVVRLGNGQEFQITVVNSR